MHMLNAMPIINTHHMLYMYMYVMCTLLCYMQMELYRVNLFIKEIKIMQRRTMMDQ